MTTSISGATPPHAAPHGERHPTALPTLFFTEMWERFSYYGMRALLGQGTIGDRPRLNTD